MMSTQAKSFSTGWIEVTGVVGGHVSVADGGDGEDYIVERKQVPSLIGRFEVGDVQALEPS